MAKRNWRTNSIRGRVLLFWKAKWCSKQKWVQGPAVGEVCLDHDFWSWCFLHLPLEREIVIMLPFSVHSFLLDLKSVLKEIHAFLLTCKSCPADCFWVRPRSPPSSSGTVQEQMLRAIVGETGYILQRHSANRSTLPYSPCVCNILPLTETGLSGIFCLCMSSIFSICSKLCHLK